MKIYCKKCNQTLDPSEFYVDTSRFNGYSSMCKSCKKKQSKKWKKENREKYNEYMKDLYHKNKIVLSEKDFESLVDSSSEPNEELKELFEKHEM